MSIDQNFIDFMVQIGKISGFDDLTAKIFAILYLEPEDIAMDDLSKQTGYSLASISNKVKLLESINLLKKIKKPKSKKIYLYIDKDYLEILKDHLLKMQQLKLNLIKDKMPAIIEEYKSKAKTEKEKKKLKILENYLSQTLKFDNIILSIIEALAKQEK